MWLLAAAAWLVALPCARAALPREVSAALGAARIPSSAVAVWVQSVAAEAPALRHNADAPMNPASTMKLLTTYAGLSLLGPSFTWKTEAWSAAPLEGDVLQGDLVLRGGGDPLLTFEQLWLMLRSLRERGIRDIGGDLVLDRSWLEPGNGTAGDFDGEPTRPYNAGPDALLVNFNAFRFSFAPDERRRNVLLVSEPPSSTLQVVNDLKYAEGPCPDWRAGLSAHFMPIPLGARGLFSGNYPASCGEQYWNISPLPHGTFVYGVFRSLWEQLGGTLRGSWRDGPVPSDARLLVRHDSPPLAEAVRDINKFSNNVMARELFLDLSAELGGPPGGAAGSADLVKAWLQNAGLAMPELVLENGSGLSRKERISAASLARLLLSAYSSAVMPEFMASLPIVASDGTMRKRLRYESLSGQAHIKTGSLAGVRSMAGYVRDERGRRHVVVFVVNHPNAAASQAAMDVLLRWVYAQP